MARSLVIVRSLILLSVAVCPAVLRAAAEDAAKQPAEKPEAASDVGEGRLVRVRLPLTATGVGNTKTAIGRIVKELKQLPKTDRRPVLVLELAPSSHGGSAGEGTSFTNALELATYLTRQEMADIKTVAYIPRSVKGHGVLVALACEQIAIDPKAEIGEATVDDEASRDIDPSIVIDAYKKIADKKRPIPIAVALGMVDRKLEVLKVETDQGIEFKLRDELDELKKDHTIISQDVVKPAGSLGSFTGSEGREHGLLQASDRDSLARGVGVPAASVQKDQSMAGGWRPVIVRIDGPLTRRKVHQIETMLGTELSKHKVNWICFVIDSSGGDLEACLGLAQKLAELHPDDVQTVAYVPVQASGGAALIALACQQVVMQPPAAHLGEEKDKETTEFDKESLADARKPIHELANQSAHSWSLLTAFLDPEIDVYSYQNSKTGEVRYFSNEEAKEQPDSENWKRGARIKAAGKTLRLDSKQAQELGVASNVVASIDELKQIYGLDGEVPTAEPNWALELIEALASPALTVLLLVIGVVGVYVELHSPGVGIGAFVAAVAFLLFFWSHFLSGTAEWLEVLLFLGGIFCVLLEVLVLPGFGVFGLGGGAMILVSIVLASQTFVLPRTESQMVELRHSLTIVAASTLIVVGTSIALRRYLPNAPVFRKLLLNPPPEEELVDLDYRESLADYSHLVGQQGVATTNLMPAGKAEFDGQLVDVIADGLPIDRGAAVVVVKTRGNRVIVHAAEV